MLLGRVIGSVWATCKDDSIEGLKLLVVQEVDLKLKSIGSFVVAVDTVQAGVGEIVLVAKGSSARQTRQTNNRPVNAVIMAIVENLSVQSLKELDKDYSRRQNEIMNKLDSVQEV